MTKNISKSIPCAYILTCRTYGSWVHGDPRSSVDRNHNEFATSRIKPNLGLQKAMQNSCTEDIFLLNAMQRKTVLQSIIDTCRFANWHLHAAHVRSNHMHIVLQTQKEPEQAMVSIKAYATRYLKKQNPELTRKKFWSLGESTGYIFRPEFISAAVRYTLEDQGEPMAFYSE